IGLHANDASTVTTVTIALMAATSEKNALSLAPSGFVDEI
ncbi:hypothetical protein L916_06009, partial [Phytophthora nicotianae]